MTKTVHVKFVGNQDHLHGDAPRWHLSSCASCTRWPAPERRVRPRGADQHVPYLVVIRTTRRSPLPAEAYPALHICRTPPRRCDMTGLEAAVGHGTRRCCERTIRPPARSRMIRRALYTGVGVRHAERGGVGVPVTTDPSAPLQRPVFWTRLARRAGNDQRADRDGPAGAAGPGAGPPGRVAAGAGPGGNGRGTGLSPRPGECRSVLWPARGWSGRPGLPP